MRFYSYIVLFYFPFCFRGSSTIAYTLRSLKRFSVYFDTFRVPPYWGVHLSHLKMLSKYPFTHLLFWTGGFTCASKNGVANKSTSSYTSWIDRFNERRSAFKIEKMKEKSFKCILKAAIVVQRCSVAMSYFFSLRTAGKLPCLTKICPWFAAFGPSFYSIFVLFVAAAISTPNQCGNLLHWRPIFNFFFPTSWFKLACSCACV